jgi:hypothetical protein
MSPDLLTDLRALRERTRADRHGYTFPLFLFGVLILLAPLCYVPMAITQEMWENGFTVISGMFPQFEPMWVHVKYPDLVGWYWVLTIVGGLWLTSWWYRRRARQSGVETDTRPAAAAAGAAMIGLLLWQPLFDIAVQELGLFPLYSLPAVNLPLLFISTALSVAVFWWSLRPQRVGWPRTAGVFVATFLATIAFGSLSIYFLDGYAALMVIGIALAMLAWWERSVLLAVIATVFVLVSIPSNHAIYQWDISTIYGVHWLTNARLYAFLSVLAPGVTLLVGGVVAAIRTRR